MIDAIAVTITITEFFKKVFSKINIEVKGVFAWILSAIVCFFVLLYKNLDNFQIYAFIVEFIQTLILSNAGYITLNNLKKE